MIERPTQQEIDAAPTFLVDANFGTATAFGVARITFGQFKFDPSIDAQSPKLTPILTVAVSEIALLQFAHEVVARAKALGVELPGDDL